MINLHNVTSITAGNVSEINPGRYARIICIKDDAHGTIKLDLFSSDYTALSTNPMEADYWRTQAAEESARADEAESLTVEWQKRHAELHLASEADRQRADSAEQRLNALKELLYKATETAYQKGDA